MIAAATERSGTRHAGANRPATPAAASAPSMIPAFITEPTSLRTLALSAAACAGAFQYGHRATSMPIAIAIFACARRSTTIVTTVSSVNAARLTASPAGAPSIVSSDNGLVAGSALHHGMWAVPITDPATNAASVASIRVLPPPAEYSVPDA